MSLRRNLSAALYVLSAVALIAAVSLVVFSTYMNRAVRDLADALGSVHLAQRAEIDLLGYARATDAYTRTALENDLRQRLLDAKQYADTPPEVETYSAATRHVNAYFARTHQVGPIMTPSPPELQAAVDSLRALVNTNMAQADQARSESERLDWIANRLGFTVAAILVIGVLAVSIWLVVFAFRPVFLIRDAIRKFALGDRSARAPERGPDELRVIASQFNAMANSIARQRENQLAFLAGVAHDLRNPLHALKMSTALMNDDEDKPKIENGRARELMGIIKRQVDYLDRMIGDLLDASRIEAGQLELRFEDRDARALVEDSIELFRDLSPKHQLTMKLPEQPVVLFCDALRIEQVLNNLISNAIKYSSKGGRVEVTLEEIGDEAVICVADEGIGIPKDQIQDIFEPFRRSHLSKGQIPGIGLGLSVARRIVEGHNGRIEVQSQVHRGTKFCIRLPLRAELRLPA